MSIQESGEMYLETILVLSKKKNHIRAIDVCEEMGFSKPSVSRALKLLKDKGLVSIGESSAITLTDDGRAIAEKIYERHTILTEFLIKLGVSKDVATHDACKIEHDISDESFYAIKRQCNKDI